ncbi:MAG: UDP-N-acetylmuramate dehydrogenase [Proteobacteria bacterium]|nr:UDP-N-acetylmuramate dehydrogenase [Pseudomonadota bacterium]
MMAAARIPAVSGELRENEPMSRHTSWRVGGPAELFFRPAGLEDLSLFLRELAVETPVFWLGLGSNLLVRDGGIPGVVIAAVGIFKDLERVAALQVRVGVSLPCTQLARQCVRWGIGPSEFFAGIPGTVGGALAMNAGAHGGETWERVRSVTTIDRRGDVRIRSIGEYQVGYRSVTRIDDEHDQNDEWFVEALLEFEAGVPASQETLKALLARRKNTQPLGLPSCGSVFRNPQGDFAARLIETAGLKGDRIGGAEVSTKHANFIINRNHASARDIEALISHVQSTVSDVHGVELVHEVHIIGEAAS